MTNQLHLHIHMEIHDVQKLVQELRIIPNLYS